MTKRVTLHTSPHKARLGQITRGKTALNRLRQVDNYLVIAHPHALSGQHPLVVDVGYGAQAWTALELWERWHVIHPQIRLFGLEIDPERVAIAQPYAQPPVIQFALGGFNVLEVLKHDRAQVIRAYNVLRQYDEAAVTPALTAMARGLAVNGWLIEGTSTPSGALVAFDLYQNTADGLVHRELVFGTNFRLALDVADFQAILPKRLIHHAHDPRPKAFFDAWRQAILRVRGRGIRHYRRVWEAVGAELRVMGYAIDTRRRILRRGFLAVRSTLLDET